MHLLRAEPVDPGLLEPRRARRGRGGRPPSARETSAARRTAFGSRQMRSIMVGTRFSTSSPGASRPSCSVSAGSNLDMSTRWLPSSIAAGLDQNGALWKAARRHEGALVRRQAAPQRRARPRSPARPRVAPISFGRPVVPPLVTIFHTGDTPGVNEPAGSFAGTDSIARHAPASDCGIPTTSDGPARSMMAERPGDGSRSETGSGTAPTAQTANMLSTNPIDLGKPIATVEPSATPRAANSGEPACSTRCTNPARVNVTSPHVSAGLPGSVSASRVVRTWGKVNLPGRTLIMEVSAGRRRAAPAVAAAAAWAAG